MYLHLGQSVVVPHSQILGVFDLDNASWAYKTREFLERAEQAGRVVWLGDDLPRSFVVVGGEAGPPMIYISQLSPATLLKEGPERSIRMLLAPMTKRRLLWLKNWN